MSHPEPHPQRGQIVPLMISGELYDFEVEDWWDRISPRFGKEGDDMVYGHVIESGRHALQLAKVVYNDDLQVPRP